MSGELIDTTEMYLRTIFELEEEGIPPLRARIAERLAQSGPTVSQTVARMERDGLVQVGDDRLLNLTESGRAYATRVMRKHRLAERLLVDVIGLDWSLVHEEACRWEHVISEEAERRLVAILDSPTQSPYGNPIPGLDELGGRGGEAAGPVRSLGAALESDQPLTIRLSRLAEPLQADRETMADLYRAGVTMGGDITVQRTSDGFTIRGATGEVKLSDEQGGHVYVPDDA